jgi:hypothetical protein
MTAYKVSFIYDSTEYEYVTEVNVPHLWNNLTISALFEAGGYPVPENLDVDLFEDMHYDVMSV